MHVLLVVSRGWPPCQALLQWFVCMFQATTYTNLMPADLMPAGEKLLLSGSELSDCK